MHSPGGIPRGGRSWGERSVDIPVTGPDEGRRTNVPSGDLPDLRADDVGGLRPARGSGDARCARRAAVPGARAAGRTVVRGLLLPVPSVPVGVSGSAAARPRRLPDRQRLSPPPAAARMVACVSAEEWPRDLRVRLDELIEVYRTALRHALDGLTEDARGDRRSRPRGRGHRSGGAPGVGVVPPGRPGAGAALRPRRHPPGAGAGPPAGVSRRRPALPALGPDTRTPRSARGGPGRPGWVLPTAGRSGRAPSP
jgi:hypothetical protein